MPRPIKRVMKKHYRNMHWTWNSRTGEQKAKQGFETLDEALLFKARHGFGNEVSPYVCDVCGKWHLGHYRKED